MADYGATDRVRRAALEQYIQPARKRGQTEVEIHSGTLSRFLVERGQLLPNRFPVVCNGLRSQRFQKENGIKLRDVRSSAASGMSSDVTFVYELEAASDGSLPVTPVVPPISSGAFAGLRGILKAVYKELGGADAFHQRERESWER